MKGRLCSVSNWAWDQISAVSELGSCCDKVLGWILQAGARSRRTEISWESVFSHDVLSNLTDSAGLASLDKQLKLFGCLSNLIPSFRHFELHHRWCEMIQKAVSAALSRNVLPMCWWKWGVQHWKRRKGEEHREIGWCDYYAPHRLSEEVI